MKNHYTSYIVWSLGLFVLLVPFSCFVIVGWPGRPDECVYDEPHSCYCEDFSLKDVEEGSPGVRQTVNTWFCLYSILTSGIVAFTRSQDRRCSEVEQTKVQGSKGGGDQEDRSCTQSNPSHPSNLMLSSNLIADWYVLVVLFLGLGSLYFHGSLTFWGGVVDIVSIYTFVAYLPWYAMRRLKDSDLIFWIGYIITVGLFSFFHSLMLLNSAIPVFICLLGYIPLEIYAGRKTGKPWLGTTANTRRLLGLSLFFISTAVFFWLASRSGQFLCHPDSFWQPHGLLWHPLTGAVSVLLYFYWRQVEDPACSLQNGMDPHKKESIDSVGASQLTCSTAGPSPELSVQIVPL